MKGEAFRMCWPSPSLWNATGMTGDDSHGRLSFIWCFNDGGGKHELSESARLGSYLIAYDSRHLHILRNTSISRGIFHHTMKVINNSTNEYKEQLCIHLDPLKQINICCNCCACQQTTLHSTGARVLHCLGSVSFHLSVTHLSILSRLFSCISLLHKHEETGCVHSEDSCSTCVVC